MQITKTTFRGGPISSHPAIAPMLAATSIDLGQDSCAIDYLVFNASILRLLANAGIFPAFAFVVLEIFFVRFHQ